MAYGDDRLLFIIEQNTAAKFIAVTEFWAIANVNLITITMETLVPASEEWGEVVTVSGTSTGIVEPTNSIMVDFGDGVLVQATVNGDGTWSATKIYEKESVGQNTITAYVVDESDIPLEDFDFPTQDFEVLKRPTTLTTNDSMEDNQQWGIYPSTASGTLTDDGTGLGVEGETIYLSGTGLGTIFDELITDSDGVYSNVGSTASFGGAVILTAVHLESDYYLAGGTGDDDYTTLQHTTELTMNHIDDVIAGHNVYLVGQLLDAGEGVVGKLITFSSNAPDGDSIDFSNPPNPPPTTTLGPVTITGPNGITVDTENLLRLNEGDSINSVNQHFLDIELVEADKVQVRVIGHDGSQTIEDNCVKGDCITGTYTLFHPAIIDRVEIKTITGTDIGVSSLATKIVPEVTVASTEFTTTTEPEPFIQFGAGYYAASGQTPLNDADDPENPFIVTACFAEDGDYFGDCIGSNSFNTSYQTNTGSGSSNTGTITNVLDDSGKGIIAENCDDHGGDASDSDAICENWETDSDSDGTVDGIPFMVGTSQYYYPLNGASTGQKDLFVEIDAMAPHADDSVAFADVVTAMSNHGVTLHHTITTDAITHVDEINVWRDNDNDSTNDFNSIKTNNFGYDDEIITMSGTPIIVVNNEKLIQSFDGNMDDDSGNNNGGSFMVGIDPVLAGTPTYVSGQIGQAIDFTATDQERVQFPDNTFNGEPEGTVTAWINPSSTSGTIFGVADSNTNNGFWKFGIINAGGDVKLIIQSRTPDNNLVRSDITFPLNTWTHVAVTGSGELDEPWKLFINGEEVSSTATTGTNVARWWDSQLVGDGNLVYTAGAFERANDATGFFNGAIDDLRVYDFQLTEDQISNMYNVGAISAPFAYYNLDGDLTDESSNSIDGTSSPLSSDSYVTGKIGDSVDFDGSTRVEFDDDSFNFPAGTVAAWINPDAAHTGVVFGAGDDSNGNGWWRFGVSPSGSDVKLFVHTRTPNNFVKTVDSFPINTWTHVAVTGTGVDTDPWKLYVNGVEKTTTATNGDNEARWWDTQQISNNGALRFDIGALEKSSGTINYFNGQIDEVRVYDSVLTEDEIAKLMDTTVDKVNSLIEISGLSIDTPDTTLTSGATEGRISIDLNVATSGDTTINEDENRSGAIIGTPDAGYTFETISVSSTGNTGNKLLEIRVPFTTTEEVDGSAGTIQVPVVSEVPITSVTMDKTATVTSTLLDAKAQAFRYVLIVHDISGGSSGAAELRGNDAVVGLGTGYGDADLTHPGTEGTTDQLAGTYMHELGHLLNMDHGGPKYLLSDPLTTLGTSAKNCNPAQKSVMTYTGQMPTYSSGSGASYTTNWALQFNTEASVIDETDLDEFVGFTLIGDPIIVWATPNPSAAQDWLLGTADGSALNWNGIGDTTDVSSDASPFDINDFDIAGCEASPGEILVALDEPAEFDFDFRAGSYGTFDGVHPQQVSDLNSVMFQEQILSGADMRVNTPTSDGTGIIEPGREVLFSFDYFTVERFGTELSEKLITDAEIRADLVFDDGTIILGDAVDGLGSFVYNSGTGKYEILWQTGEDQRGPFGVKAQVLIDNVSDDQADGKERTLHDTAVPLQRPPLAVAGPDGVLTEYNDASWPDDDVLVTFKVTLQTLIDQAIELLEAENNQCANETVRNLNAAIREFNKDNDNKGIQKVGNAVQNVHNCGNSGDVSPELVTEVNELLVQFTRNMAEDAINDALEAGGDPALITKAHEDLTSGDEKRALGDYQSAHTFYSKSFEITQSALP
jgi:hypothetical protein